jgi:NAD+ kinase
MHPGSHSTLTLKGLIPRLEIHYDPQNLLALGSYQILKPFECTDGLEPDLIVPLGGDGFMMHCIRKNWHRNIPFYGVNAGTLGYLLNDPRHVEELFSAPLKVHLVPMLYVEAEKEAATGETQKISELAFNDAWLERMTGQTALIRISVSGEERLRVRGDGVLVATAAGSTAYSVALGASPIPVGAPLIQMVGSNITTPAQWKPVHLNQEEEVGLEVIDSYKRPCRGFVDGVDIGQVTKMMIRTSRVAGVQIVFCKSCDLQQKLFHMQFPHS